MQNTVEKETKYTFVINNKNLEFEIIVNDAIYDIDNKYMLGIINDFEEYKWRLDYFIAFIMGNIHETALTIKERDYYINKKDYAQIIEASSKNINLTDNKLGEIGEIVLYGIMRRYYSAFKLVPKIFYKQNKNMYAQGFDSVHITLENEDILLWLGEAKLWKNIKDAMTNVYETLKEHLEKDFIKKELAFAYNNEDFKSLENEPSITKEHYFKLKDMLNTTKSIDNLKEYLHIPILIIYECNITKNAKEKSEEYKEYVRNFIIEKSKEFFNNLNEKITDYYKNISFHLILFPIHDIEEVRNKFKCKIEAYRC